MCVCQTLEKEEERGSEGEEEEQEEEGDEKKKKQQEEEEAEGEEEYDEEFEEVTQLLEIKWNISASASSEGPLHGTKQFLWTSRPQETDYVMSYFDNGEDFGGDSDDNMDEAIYWNTSPALMFMVVLAPLIPVLPLVLHRHRPADVF